MSIYGTIPIRQRVGPKKADIGDDMLIQITQCSDPLMWYVDQVGEYYECDKVDEYGYWTRDTERHINFVAHGDAEVVDE